MVMRNLTLGIVTSLTLGLFACVVEEAPLPGSGNKDTVSVVGVDANANGLRDDVEVTVFAYSDTNTRDAVIQLAKAMQSFIVTGTSKSNALIHAASMNRAIDCLYSLNPENFGDRVDAVEAVVVNTGNRMRAYAKAGAFLSGGAYSVSTVGNNGASCEETP